MGLLFFRLCFPSPSCWSSRQNETEEKRKEETEKEKEEKPLPTNEQLPSAGLEPTGSPSGSCSSSPGQVYARAGSYQGAFAIMYSWYMPKDSPSSGLGHRHDWENAVIWLDAESESARVIGGAASAHGDFDTTTSPDLDGGDGGLLVRYFSVWPVNHQ